MASAGGDWSRVVGRGLMRWHELIQRRWIFGSGRMDGGEWVLGQSQWGFIESFMILNIINFADVARREKDGVSWNVKRVSSS